MCHSSHRQTEARGGKRTWIKNNDSNKNGFRKMEQLQKENVDKVEEEGKAIVFCDILLNLQYRTMHIMCMKWNRCDFAMCARTFFYYGMFHFLVCSIVYLLLVHFWGSFHFQHCLLLLLLSFFVVAINVVRLLVYCCIPSSHLHAHQFWTNRNANVCALFIRLRVQWRKKKEKEKILSV